MFFVSEYFESEQSPSMSCLKTWFILPSLSCWVYFCHYFGHAFHDTHEMDTCQLLMQQIYFNNKKKYYITMPIRELFPSVRLPCYGDVCNACGKTNNTQDHSNWYVSSHPYMLYLPYLGTNEICAWPRFHPLGMLQYNICDQSIEGFCYRR